MDVSNCRPTIESIFGLFWSVPCIWRAGWRLSTIPFGMVLAYDVQIPFAGVRKRSSHRGKSGEDSCSLALINHPGDAAGVTMPETDARQSRVDMD